MISPYGVKVNMVCASCEYCKMPEGSSTDLLEKQMSQK